MQQLIGVLFDANLLRIKRKEEYKKGLLFDRILRIKLIDCPSII